MPKKYNTEFGRYYHRLEYGEASALARKAGTSRQYLWSIAAGVRKPGMDVASRLIAADENITLGMLRPDYFQD